MDNYGGSADQLVNVNSNLQLTELNLALIPKGGKYIYIYIYIYKTNKKK